MSVGKMILKLCLDVFIIKDISSKTQYKILEPTQKKLPTVA